MIVGSRNDSFLFIYIGGFVVKINSCSVKEKPCDSLNKQWLESVQMNILGVVLHIKYSEISHFLNKEFQFQLTGFAAFQS